MELSTWSAACGCKHRRIPAGLVCIARKIFGTGPSTPSAVAAAIDPCEISVSRIKSPARPPVAVVAASRSRLAPDTPSIGRRPAIGGKNKLDVMVLRLSSPPRFVSCSVDTPSRGAPVRGPDDGGSGGSRARPDPNVWGLHGATTPHEALITKPFLEVA